MAEQNTAEQNQILATQLQSAIAELSNFKQQTQQALDGFKDYQKSTISKFHEKIERKRKIDHVQFKNPGNEDQFNHAKQMMECMDDIEEALNEDRLEDAKKALKSGKQAVEYRMKLIKIAEREGWGCVKHFVSDNLVSGDEEEKRLKKAIRANSSTKEAKKAKISSSHTSTNSQNRGDLSQNFNNQSNNAYYRRKLDSIQCFNCRLFGHYAYNCPYPSSRDNVKVPRVEENEEEKN